MRNIIFTYNTIVGLIKVSIISILLSVTFAVIGLILCQPFYIQFIPGLVSLSFNISNTLLNTALYCVCGIIVIFLITSFLEFSFSKVIFDIFETWQLRRFIKKMPIDHFSTTILKTYVDSAKNGKEVKWLIKIPIHLQQASELKNNLNSIYEYISYNNSNYIFSGFERKENYYILIGTLNK